MAVRERAGREASSSAGAFDSKVVKITEASDSRGFGAGKKINGSKRNPMTDTLAAAAGARGASGDSSQLVDGDGEGGPHHAEVGKMSALA